MLLDRLLIELEPADVAALVDARQAVLVDVREDDEFAEERIAGSLLQPMSDFEPDSWAPVPGYPETILMCLGGVRSAAVGRRLMQAGHAKVVHLKGGLVAWKAAGLPTES